MLRTSLRSVRALGSKPAAAAAGRQWQAAVVRRGLVRSYAIDNKPTADNAKLPASETLTAPSTAPPPPASAVAPTIPLENAPLTPPAPAAAVPPPPPPSPPLPRKKGFFRRLRNYILTLTILSALGFGGGVWYSRINDNFHDFFTEYIPYGEQAVLYMEEMDFRKRFPNVASRVSGRSSRDAGEQVTIPAQSGASWRVADGGEPAGRQSSAIKKTAAAVKEAVKPQDAKVPASVVEAQQETAKLPVVESKATPPAAPVKPEATTTPEAIVAKVEGAAKAVVKKDDKTKGFKAPEVDEPSRWPPASPIDPLAIPDAAEPVVQDLVRMLNDIITVINHDNANEKYASTIYKAKNELAKVGSKIRDIKAAVEKDAAKEVRAKTDHFEKAANELITRIDAAMVNQEVHWQIEFEEELKALQKAYNEKVEVVRQRERDIHEAKLQNKLLEQAIELQRQFTAGIKQHVEEERDSRLGKLEDLSAAVKQLEKLTNGWNEVVDSNLRTQQLHVAVDAVRASLEDAHHPRPFIKELVALKEIAADDAVVDAAIASIHPSAYQRGISTSAELVDRFRRVATEVRKAALLPDDAGVASHASSLVLSKLMFKKQGLAAGDDVESILTRTQTYLEEGDLDNAAREMNGLSGWAKTLSRDWLGEVRKVLEVQQALEVIQAEARLQSLRVE
ncbi:Mitochondrial inner membrane protein Mitofilin [Rhypophila decipiens]